MHPHERLDRRGFLKRAGCLATALGVARYTPALALGLNYGDTAPAYAGSQDYYGRVLPRWRDKIFLASKTHERTRLGALRLLDDSLKRLGTDHLDLWQLHDLRTREDLDAIFAPEGAIHAMEEAKRQGRVRCLGITGHNNPDVLTEAIRRYPFDTLLVALNAADRARHHAAGVVGDGSAGGRSPTADRVRSSFIEEVLPLAAERGMGVIGMKVLGRGRLVQPDGPLTAAQAIRYVLTLPVSTVIIGCSTPAEVEENVRIAHAFSPLAPEEMARLEGVAAAVAREATFYKRA